MRKIIKLEDMISREELESIRLSINNMDENVATLSGGVAFRLFYSVQNKLKISLFTKEEQTVDIQYWKDGQTEDQITTISQINVPANEIYYHTINNLEQGTVYYAKILSKEVVSSIKQTKTKTNTGKLTRQHLCTIDKIYSVTGYLQQAGSYHTNFYRNRSNAKANISWFNPDFEGKSITIRCTIASTSVTGEAVVNSPGWKILTPANNVSIGCEAKASWYSPSWSQTSSQDAQPPYPSTTITIRYDSEDFPNSEIIAISYLSAGQNEANITSDYDGKVYANLPLWE